MDMCDNLHKLFCSLQRYTYMDISRIPFDDGIYIIFEVGEKYKGWDRIVRIGTHIASGRLKRRLYSHFKSKNKDGSIFRKNIGRAILNKRKDPYLQIWNLDTSKLKNKEFRDIDKQAEIEIEVSKYMCSALSFAVIKVEQKEKRLRLERAIISSLCHGKDFKASEKWLGSFSTEFEIQKSGMWLKQGLDALPLIEDEYKFIESICGDL